MTDPKIPAPKPVAHYVQRQAPGKRDDGMKLGPWWRKSDADEWVDDRHALKHLIDADAAEAYAAAREAAARMEERELIATKLRKAGATIPAPAPDGTIEGALNTGLCLALVMVETDEIRAG